MFDNWTLGEKIIGIIIAVLVAAVPVAINYGMIGADVARLKEDVASLKKPESKRPDLCKMLMEPLRDGLQSGDDAQVERVSAQLERFDCYNIATPSRFPTPQELERMFGSDSAMHAAMEDEEMPESNEVQEAE